MKTKSCQEFFRLDLVMELLVLRDSMLISFKRFNREVKGGDCRFI